MQGLIADTRQFFNRPVILILLSLTFLYCAILAPYCYHFFGRYDVQHISSLLFVAFYSAFCFFVLPFLTARFLLDKNEQDLGLVIPKKKFLLFIVVAEILVLPFIIYFAKLPAFRHYYYLGNLSFFSFLLVHTTLIPLYYFAEEFFFRGFLFLSLWKKIGWHSYWITDFIFIVAHFSKPGLEIIFSIPVGILLNYMALKSKSIFPSMIVHYSMGLLLNMLVNY